MARYELRSFIDIINAVMEQLKYQSSDTVSKNRIKRNINTIYEEVQAYSNWLWNRGFRTLQVEPYYSAGTATVTAGSVTVTVTSAPGPSKKGFYFSASDYSEVYRIASHTAGSATITLETPYTGSTSSSASYRIWTDAIPLPNDCKETIEVRHQFRDKPVESVGLQEYRRIVDTSPKAEGRPMYYTTSDWRDPAPYSSIGSLPASVSRSSEGVVKTVVFASSVASLISEGDYIEVSGAGNYTYNVEAIVTSVSTTTITYTAPVALQESSTADTGIVVKALNAESRESYRELLVYPVISSNRTTLHVDYIKVLPPLEDDTDEPAIPLHDRRVLLHGAMWMSWDRERDPEGAQTHYQLFQRALERMASKIEDSIDKPVLQVSRAYLGGKRYPTRSRSMEARGLSGASGGSSSTVVTGTASRIAVFNSSGDLVASDYIDIDESNWLNNNEPLQSSTVSNNTTATVDSWTVATYNRVTIEYSVKRGSAYEAGVAVIISDGTNASISIGPTPTIGSPGVGFSADVSAGSLRFRATTDNSGSSATIQWKVSGMWLV